MCISSKFIEIKIAVKFLCALLSVAAENVSNDFSFIHFKKGEFFERRPEQMRKVLKKTWAKGNNGRIESLKSSNEMLFINGIPTDRPFS